jgi:hypothetical protein
MNDEQTEILLGTFLAGHLLKNLQIQFMEEVEGVQENLGKPLVRTREEWIEKFVEFLKNSS